MQTRRAFAIAVFLVGILLFSMVEITVDYKGELHCLAQHSPSGSVITTDAPVDNHGRGEAFSPTDLLATSLVTCMATIMSIKARSMNVELKGTRLRVEKHMSATAPRRIARLPVEVWFSIPFTDEQKISLERAALGCPVHHSLHPDIEKPITFHWKD